MKDEITKFELNRDGLTPLERVCIGDWHWVTSTEEEWNGEEQVEVESRELMCVDHIASNHVQFRRERGHGYDQERIHFDDFAECCEEEPNWREHLNEQMAEIQAQMKEIMSKMIEEGRSLYLLPQEGAQDKSESKEEQESLLPAKVMVSPRKHQKDLIEFKKNMPALQKEIEELAEEFAVTAKQMALPDLVNLQHVKKALSIVEDRIFTLELYCGLQETVEQIKDGEPAEITEPVRLMQQLLYMDEECLFDYDDGGMDYSQLSDFDKWVVKPENLERLAPHKRCVVGFRVRRHRKDRGEVSSIAEAWVRFREEMADLETYLLIRNGEKVYRIASPVDFSPRLVPKRDELGEDQFLKIDRWHREKEPEKIGPDHLDYDKHVAKLDRDIKHYNRVIILLQGMFDRSKIFWPHPGVKLTRDDHMEKWVKCVRDEEDGLPNNSVTWEEYRDQMNKTVRKGKKVWSKWYPDSYGRYHWSSSSDRVQYSQVEMEVIQRPRVCEVVSVKKDKSEVRIKWVIDKYVYGRWDRSGCWVDGHDKKQSRYLWVPTEHVFNLSDYTLGDYKMFLCDRTLQGNYLEWASQLLHAEDEARKVTGRDVSLKSKRPGWTREVCVGPSGEEYVVESSTNVPSLPGDE
jgi:hypothetical protein